MKLLVGLGNPGKIYEKTRHNVGFRVLKEYNLWSSSDFSSFKLNKKFKALVSLGNLLGEKIILALPQTFMNNSGLAVAALVHFYKIKPPALWVIHDDVDLPLGRIRIKKGGGSAGHKGVASIIEKLGTKDFVRFRVGIGNKKQEVGSRKPHTKTSLVRGRQETEKFVLQKFTKEEKRVIDELVKKTAEAMEVSLKEGLEKAMSKFN